MSNGAVQLFNNEIERGKVSNISIVIPVFNGASLLPDCLRSVGAAVARLTPGERELIQIIVCDNHSNDESPTIAAKFDPGCEYRIVRPAHHFSNRTRNWNFAFAHAEASWVMMLRHDDLLSAAAISRILELIPTSGVAGSVAIAGKHRVIDVDGTPGRLRPRLPFPTRLSGLALRTEILPMLCVFVPFTPIRRSSFVEIGGFDDSLELVQDWDLWIRIASLGDIYYDPTELGWWRAHSFSDQYALRFAQEHLVVAERLLIGPETELPHRLRTVVARSHAWHAMQLSPDSDFELLTQLTIDQTQVQEWLASARSSDRRRAMALLRGFLSKERLTQAAKMRLLS